MPSKTIKKEITLTWEKVKGGVVCSNAETLQYLWGSKTSSTDLCAWYGVERRDKGYFIPIKILKVRLGKLEYDKIRIDNSIEVIKKSLADDAKGRATSRARD